LAILFWLQLLIISPPLSAASDFTGRAEFVVEQSVDFIDEQSTSFTLPSSVSCLK